MSATAIAIATMEPADNAEGEEALHALAMRSNEFPKRTSSGDDGSPVVGGTGRASLVGMSTPDIVRLGKLSKSRDDPVSTGPSPILRRRTECKALDT